MYDQNDARPVDPQIAERSLGSTLLHVGGQFLDGVATVSGGLAAKAAVDGVKDVFKKPPDDPPKTILPPGVND